MSGGPKGSNRVGTAASSQNIFAALDTLKKKKSDCRRSNESSNGNSGTEQEPHKIWGLSSLAGKSWADVEDDDDYYATTAPPQFSCDAPKQRKNNDDQTRLEELQESESEDDDLDDGVQEPKNGQPMDSEVPEQAVPVAKKASSASLATKETERQLSKKELKKKELADLEAVLAELGISNKHTGKDIQAEVKGVPEKEEKKHNEIDKMNENAAAPEESKTSKKKKTKKEKSSMEAQELPSGSVADVADEGAGVGIEGDASAAFNIKEQLKKMASSKKKKSNKGPITVSNAVSAEAAARSAKLAAAKKKEKNHYNQQPIR